MSGVTSIKRFNQRPWNKGQCEMLLIFLSFAKNFILRFFLLENVKNIVSFNKGSTFQLILASLLEIDYQVVGAYQNDYINQPLSVDKKISKTWKDGGIVGLKAYVICQLLEIGVSKECMEITQESTQLKARRFYRPEDVSKSKSYSSNIRELPAHVKLLPYIQKKADNNKLRNHRLKAKCTGDKEQDKECGGIAQKVQFASLDIFSSCGGLSEGLKKSGIVFMRWAGWAIENDRQAGEAFCLNHLKAKVFVDDRSVILSAIMLKCGDFDDCISTPEAEKFAANLAKEKLRKLPLPGQVYFIYRGPPHHV